MQQCNVTLTLYGYILQNLLLFHNMMKCPGPLPADDGVARKVFAEHLSFLEEQVGSTAFTPALAEGLTYQLGEQQARTHQTNRTVGDIAAELSVSNNTVLKLLGGMSILDVGCGEGVFAKQLSRDKRTHVVGIDTNPSILPKPSSDREEYRTGSGYNIRAAVHGTTFDAATIVYSSLTWARNPEQVRAAITSPLEVIRPGGTALFIPFLQHPKNTQSYFEAIKRGIIPGMPGKPTEAELEIITDDITAAGMMQLEALRTLHELEETGEVTVSHRPSRTNTTRKPLHPTLDAIHHPYELYSVILQLSDQQ